MKSLPFSSRNLENHLPSLRRETNGELLRPELTLVNWLLKFLVIWLSFDIAVIATGWYAEHTIKVQFPNWWRKVICNDESGSEPEFDIVASFPGNTLT
jgi:hypothetical protein